MDDLSIVETQILAPQAIYRRLCQKLRWPTMKSSRVQCPRVFRPLSQDLHIVEHGRIQRQASSFTHKIQVPPSLQHPGQKPSSLLLRMTWTAALLKKPVEVHNLIQCHL